MLDTAALRLGGIEVGTVESITTSGLPVTGAITYDADRVSHVGSRSDGRIIAVRADLGARVRRGQALAVLGFETEKRRMQVISLNPGVSREQVQDNTGFRLDFAAHLGVTEPPTAQELKVLRELDPERLYTA